ncbi:MAG: hypothetical protein ACQETH_00495 [Candidatus Rifleibacteriota bacterium]
MKTHNKKIITSFILILLSAMSVSGQVLEVVPDDIEAAPVVERNPHTGTCYTGSSGLVTIPTPDFQETKVAFTYKAGTYEQDLNISGVKTEVEKDEVLAGLRFNLSPHVELSVAQLAYERKSNPSTTGLNYEEDAVAFGMKYSAHHGSKDICLGFTFAPMSAQELNLADIEQIENLRNAYMTISESIDTNTSGYLHLASVFTKKQEIDFGNGVTQKVNRKDILIGALGLEYSFADYVSIFGEYKVGNYRDIFTKDSVRHRFHAGLRLGNKNIQAELTGMNLSEDNPTLVLGGTLAF